MKKFTSLSLLALGIYVGLSVYQALHAYDTLNLDE
jgi:hypothetical protein